MMNRRVLLSVVLVSLPAMAGDPGEPLGCSELVILEPRMECQEAIRPCADFGASDFSTHCLDLITAEIDNEGNIYSWARSPNGLCGVGELFRHDLIRFDGTAERIVASIDDRCVDPKTARRDAISFAGLRFDSVAGKLYFSALSLCREGPGFPCDDPQVENTEEPWLGAIDGFPTLVEVLKQEIGPESLENRL